MRLGCIDIGSNTTRLLVADCEDDRLVWIHQERAFTRLGRDLLESPAIPAAKITEVVDVVLDQLAIAREHGVLRTYGVATAAVRAAENGTELTEAIEAACGLEVEILSARDEARLAFAGVAGTLEQPLHGEIGVVDVGGGSSELVVGTVAGGVRWWASLPLGSGSLSHIHLTSDPPTAEQLGITRLQIAAALATIEAPHPPAAVAVGGSATSLSRLAGAVLDGAALGRALSQLTAAPSAEIADRFMIDPERARLLPAGLLIPEGRAELLGVGLHVGRGGLREGVLLEAARS